MVAGDRSRGTGIAVKLISETTVRATDESTTDPYMFPLSNLDRLVSGIPVLIFYAYPKPPTGDFPSILDAIKISLTHALGHFPPFAGQISQSPTGEAQILCNNSGVKLVEASANISLPELDFYRQNETIRNLLLPADPGFPLTVQITSYRCGGFSISWIFDHVLADASGFVKFLSAWCEIARAGKLSTVAFNLDRLTFRPRRPPVYNHLVGRTYSVCGMDDILDSPPNWATERHLYLVKGSTLESLRAAASEGGPKRTRTEALSAHLWKLMAKSFDKCDCSSYAKCKMGWVVDGRKRIDGESETMMNYAGNAVTMAVGEGSIQDLKEGSIGYVAGVVSQAIQEVASREHFADLIDWVEFHRPRKMVPNIVLGSSAPAIVVSSCHNMAVMSMDFGYGSPSVGMFSSAVDKLCAGYVNLVSSGKEDGSWFVSAFVWRGLAAELELDPDHVFVPITPQHLGL